MLEHAGEESLNYTQEYSSVWQEQRKKEFSVRFRFNRMDQFTRYNLLADFLFCWCSAGWKIGLIQNISSTVTDFINQADFHPLTQSFYLSN